MSFSSAVTGLGPSRLVEVGPAPRPLDVAAPALALDPPSLRRPRRLRLGARARQLEGTGEAAGQALERELAVAVLGAGVLRHRGHAGAEAAADAGLLLRRQRRRGVHVE